MGARRRAMSFASGRRMSAGSRRIAGSLNRLKRKGSTASCPSGPPRLNSTTARRPIFSAMLVPENLDERRDMLGRGFRQHAMAEIEDQAPAAEPVEDSLGRLAKGGTPGDQCVRIEIALNGHEWLKRIRRPVEIHLAIEAEPGQVGYAGIVGIHLTGAA